jgi:hypothetical protein
MATEKDFQAIVTDATRNRTNLAQLDHSLQIEIDEIVMMAAKQNRPLSDSDKEKRRGLRARQAEVQELFEELAFATLARLNNAVDKDEFKRAFQSINANLEDDLATLKKIQRYAAIAAKVADGLAKLALKVAAL